MDIAHKNFLLYIRSMLKRQKSLQASGASDKDIVEWVRSLTGMDLDLPLKNFGAHDQWIKIEGESLVVPVYVRSGYDPERGPVITAVMVGDPFARQAVGTSALHKVTINPILDVIDEADPMRGQPTLFSGHVPTPGGQPKDIEVFKEAARAYADVASESSAPIQAVADVLAVNRSTASRRIKRARELGLIANAERSSDG